jgi:four helix bundle protein
LLKFCQNARFGEEIIKFARGVIKNEVTRPIVNQLIKCGTGVGANYCEADDAESGRDFKHKIGICKKKARETKHFLRMAVVAAPEARTSARKLWQEAKELNLIFNKIYKSCLENERRRKDKKLA